MGVFDYFSKRNGEDTREGINLPKSGNFANVPLTENGATGLSQVAIYKPKSFEDVENVIRHLTSKSPAIVYLNEIKDSTAQRVLDMLSGAIFALQGGVFEIETGIFIFTPCGIEVK